MIKLKQNVMYSMCDFNGQLSVTSIFEIIENMVSITLGDCGISNDILAKDYNAMSVFVRNKVVIIDRPFWNEEITITSKIIKVTHVKIYLLIGILDSNNNLCSYGILENIIIDKNTKMIKKVSGFPFVNKDKEEDIDIKYNDISEDNLVFIKDILITSDYIDFSMHTNNVCYINMILSCFKVNEFNDFKFKNLEISYNTETKEEDIVSIYSSVDKKTFVIKKDDKIVIKALFTE